MNRRNLTRRSDLSSVFHNHAKHILDRRAAIVEIVRSGNGLWRIRSQVRRGSDIRNLDSEIPGRDVVFVTSIDRDVMRLGGLQDEAHELISEGVHVLAPRHREVQEIEKPTWCGINNEVDGGED